MAILRTPEERFENLPGYPFAPHYSTVTDPDLGDIRIHHVDEGPKDGPVALLMHGEPTWSYLYRKMIPPLVAAGVRCIAPDLVGFGKSDKPSEKSDYTYARHVRWMSDWFTGLGLTDVTLFCQDWGSLIGLRLLTAFPDRFARVCVSNGFLPTGDPAPGEAFFRWQQMSQMIPDFDSGMFVGLAGARPVPDEVKAAYNAPFPDESYKAGARAFPLLVPASKDDPEHIPNTQAWTVLEAWTKPLLTAFGDSDPITAGADKQLQARVPGAKGQPHTIVEKAGHFSQEDAGPELAEILARFMGRG
ncbi:MAG: haloalkane dehalogenase [Alphaproteobacteria bacterium]|nr:haloalkane dehalogenase [Alphaproteobacteria bacterium]